MDRDFVHRFISQGVRTTATDATTSIRGTLWAVSKSPQRHCCKNCSKTRTLSGGDPLQQPHDELLALLKGLKAHNVNVWCFTGYTFEQLLTNPQHKELLGYIDVLVDSPFVLAQRDTTLRFRGSTNQRILDVRASLAASRPVLTPYQESPIL